MAIPKMGLMAWFNMKIVDPLNQILRRGLEPKQLAFSTALGITLGIFPICGVTVLLCGVAIAFLGSLCHAPTVLLANFIATPLELSLVVPFLRFGEVMSGGPHFPLTSDALKKVFTGQASREVILSVVHALPFLPNALAFDWHCHVAKLVQVAAAFANYANPICWMNVENVTIYHLVGDCNALFIVCWDG
ncbi:hypothetical protein DKX38_019883 [Salix brachista]|uniref:DUF2062 domain-containing protein n=1 Tax=Salix brachista TaxID=2182728 RepID=A0A5N5KHD8_9ROSI|nr:hypothetical protein DKX38_019883 [Salix brachista]